jgi:hypothetical protein
LAICKLSNVAIEVARATSVQGKQQHIVHSTANLADRLDAVLEILVGKGRTPKETGLGPRLAAAEFSLFGESCSGGLIGRLQSLESALGLGDL